MEVVEHEPLRRRMQEVRQRKPGRGPVGCEVPAAEEVDGHRTGRDRARLNDEEERRVGPQQPQRREGRDERVEVGPEPGELLAPKAGDGEEVAVRRRPHRLGQVPDVEAARPECAVLEDGERGEPCAERDDPRGDQGLRSPHRAATARSRSERQRAPRTASEACSSYVARPPSASAAASSAEPAILCTAWASASGSPGGTSSASAPSVSSSRRGRRVGGDHRAGARERLEDLVRDHARRLRRPCRRSRARTPRAGRRRGAPGTGSSPHARRSPDGRRAAARAGRRPRP